MCVLTSLFHDRCLCHSAELREILFEICVGDSRIEVSDEDFVRSSALSHVAIASLLVALTIETAGTAVATSSTVAAAVRNCRLAERGSHSLIALSSLSQRLRVTNVHALPVQLQRRRSGTVDHSSRTRSIGEHNKTTRARNKQQKTVERIRSVLRLLGCAFASALVLAVLLTQSFCSVA